MQNAISSLKNLSWYFIGIFDLVKDIEDLSSISKHAGSCANNLKIYRFSNHAHCKAK